MSDTLKIAVTGTRGFPDIQGGVENHCEHLYTQLAKKGNEIIVYTREPYVRYTQSEYKRVSLVPLKCPRQKYLETVIHTFKSIIAARKLNVDVLHIHSIGASFFTLLARLFGMKVVVTHHGPDYKREKWNTFAKIVLRVCEIIGMTFANEVIVITKEISDHVKKKFNRDSTIIPNGVMLPSLENTGRKKVLEIYGLQEGKYFIIVGRFVPEKAFDVLINAFNKADLKYWKLVIVGEADHRDGYSALVEKNASQNKNIILTGLLSGEPLHQLYKYAGHFVIPSFYEGLPIVLLEAMSYGLSCIASDIPGNRDVFLDKDRYFIAGNINALKEKLEYVIGKTWSEEDKRKQIDFINQNYNWEKIADSTFKVYQRALIRSKLVPITSTFQSDKKIKIAVLGTRGFPNVQGGVEVHCQNLYPPLVEKGCEVIVFTRKPYVNPDIESYKGVRFIHLTCPQNKYFEAFVHTLKGLWVSKKIKPDILHIHAIGPSVISPIAKMLNMKVVVTHHGENYKHMKWGLFAKQALKFCEVMGMKYSDSIIAITENIACAIRGKFDKYSYVIPNGVNMPSISSNNDQKLKELGLDKRNYILNVCRFVPEKGIDVLIDAFNKTEIQSWKLVIVGRADHSDSYSKRIEKMASKNKNVILTGFLSGEPLMELYSNAGLFVLPSFYEGLPIVLLEAMSYGLSCIVSDIPGNRLALVGNERFFKAGDVDMLKEKIEEFYNKSWTDEDRENLSGMIAKQYNWNSISKNILKVYKKTLTV